MTTPKQNAAFPQEAAPLFNPLKHGIKPPHQVMFDETAADLGELSAEYHQQHRPGNSVERFLVDTLINNEWRLRRMRCVEADLWVHATNTYFGKNPQIEACSTGDAFVTATLAFEHLQRLANSCERIYHRALKELQRLQMARAHALDTQQTEQSKATSASLASFRDFPKNPPPAGPQPPPATPATAPFAQPEPAATPTESHPSAADRGPELPKGA
jgi:hypothetical protein